MFDVRSLTPRPTNHQGAKHFLFIISFFFSSSFFLLFYPFHSSQFDKKWDNDPNFVFYDFNKPEELAEALNNSFDMAVIDPPFIGEEVLWINEANLSYKTFVVLLFPVSFTPSPFLPHSLIHTHIYVHTHTHTHSFRPM